MTHDDPEPTRINPTAEQLRALTHPIRLRLLGLLRADGPQTSAELARATDLNTGATSYHLRMLAQYGFIEDAPELSSGRKRYWRASHTVTTVPDDTAEASDTDLDERAAFRQSVAVTYASAMQAAVQEWTELPADWRDVSELSDILIRITPDEARELRSRVGDLLQEYMTRFPADAQRSDGAELFALQIAAFPRPGRLPHRDDA